MSGWFSRSFLNVERLLVFRQRECPIHFREFPVSTTLPQRFCKNCQTSVLFRLAPINFHLRLHGNTPRTACLRAITHKYTPEFRAHLGLPATNPQDGMQPLPHERVCWAGRDDKGIAP
jgi:hypothetical protein